MAGPYYVDTTTGNDTDTGLTELLAFATIQKAFDVTAGGGHVYIKGSADYSEAVVPITFGLSATPNIIEGYTTTPGDGGQFTLSGGGSLTSGMSGVYPAHHVFKNMIIDNYTGTGFDAAVADYVKFINCEFTNNGGMGVALDNYPTFIDCIISNNSSTGADMDIGGTFLRCEIAGNGTYGVFCGGNGCLAYNSIFIGNGTRNIGGFLTLVNSTIDGQNVAGCSGVYGTSIQMTVLNSIIYDCANGIHGSAVSFVAARIGMNNLLNSNTTDYTNWDTGEQASDITDPPGFTDEAGGDYTLGAASAARNAGADASGTSSPGMDIGAHQSEDAGGGDRTIITG